MPVILAIETSNPSASPPAVAVCRADGGVVTLLGREQLHEPDRHDDDLVPAIDRLLTRLGLRPRELGVVAVSVGPGGFTGLRTAVTTAQLIAEATGAACVPVPTALAAAQCLTPAPDGAFAVVLASKGEAAHVSVLNRSADGAYGYVATDGGGGGGAGGGGFEGAVLRADQLPARTLSCIVGDRFMPDAFRRLGVPVVPLVLDPLAVAQVSVGRPAVDPAALLPIYAREPEAVTKWRALHGPQSAG